MRSHESREFQFFAAFLKRRCGVDLESGRTRLTNSRLVPLAARFGFKDVGALIDRLEVGDEMLARAAVDAMTTQHSAFFRDGELFAHLEQSVFPQLFQARIRTRMIRIWCAATGLGQEAYSVAMIMHKALATMPGWQADILATDISERAIGYARAGRYQPGEMKGIKGPLLQRYFLREGDVWRLSEDVRTLIRFVPFNLLDSYDQMGRFDIILCRNVLMYFDGEAKANVLARLSDCLADDGILALGSTESAFGMQESFAAVPRVGGLFAKKTNALFPHLMGTR